MTLNGKIIRIGHCGLKMPFIQHIFAVQTFLRKLINFWQFILNLFILKNIAQNVMVSWPFEAFTIENCYNLLKANI